MRPYKEKKRRRKDSWRFFFFISKIVGDVKNFDQDRGINLIYYSANNLVYRQKYFSQQGSR